MVWTLPDGFFTFLWRKINLSIPHISDFSKSRKLQWWENDSRFLYPPIGIEIPL
jgi:hypothetical protein